MLLDISEHTPATPPLLAFTYLALRFQHIARCFNIKATSGNQTQQADFDAVSEKNIDTERSCDDDAVWFWLHLLDSFRWIWLVLYNMKHPEGAQSCWESYDEAHQQFGPTLRESNMESNCFWEALKHSRTWSNQIRLFLSRGRHKYTRFLVDRNFDSWPNMTRDQSVQGQLHIWSNSVILKQWCDIA